MVTPTDHVPRHSRSIPPAPHHTSSHHTPHLAPRHTHTSPCSDLHLANVGDCRAVVCDDGEARVLTWDHKPTCNERERTRLQEAGARVTADGYVQLAAEGTGECTDIALSRALGGLPYLYCAHNFVAKS